MSFVKPLVIGLSIHSTIAFWCMAPINTVFADGSDGTAQSVDSMTDIALILARELALHNERIAALEQQQASLAAAGMEEDSLAVETDLGEQASDSRHERPRPKKAPPPAVARQKDSSDKFIGPDFIQNPGTDTYTKIYRISLDDGQEVIITEQEYKNILTQLGIDPGMTLTPDAMKAIRAGAVAAEKKRHGSESATVASGPAQPPKPPIVSNEKMVTIALSAANQLIQMNCPNSVTYTRFTIEEMLAAFNAFFRDTSLNELLISQFNSLRKGSYSPTLSLTSSNANQIIYTVRQSTRSPFVMEIVKHHDGLAKISCKGGEAQSVADSPKITEPQSVPIHQ